MVRVAIRFTGVNQLVSKLANAAAGLVGGARVTVGHSGRVAYAKAVHDGSKPHIITPRVKKALYWQGAMHPVGIVRHPGYKGNPYLTDALAAKQGEINVLFGVAVRTLIGGGPGNIRAWAKASGELVEGEARRRANKGKTGNLAADIHTAIHGR